MSDLNNKAVYVQLMENILDKIRKGEYRVGEKIMSERQMASAYGINRLTVRNAIKHLIQDGYLNSVHGKGTFVSTMPTDDKKVQFGDSEIVSLSHSLRQSGFEASRIVLSFKKVKASNEVDTHFTENRELHELIRLSTIDKTPYALQICYFPADVFDTPERFDFGKGSLYTYMDSQGHLPKTYISNMEVVPIPQQYQQTLDIEQGKLVFYYEYYAYDEEGQIIEFTKAYYKPEFTSFKFVTQK